MATKLTWEYQNNANPPEYRAEFHDLVIRAVHDDDATNPFEDGDCNWPIIVRSPDAFHGFRTYEFGNRSTGLHLCRGLPLTDAQIIHDQHAIAEVLGWKGPDRIKNILEAYVTVPEEIEGRKYCRDPDLLRHAFEQALDDRSSSGQLKALCELYTLAGIPAHLETVTGYCQGDWAEVLVVATPEAIKRFGCKDIKPEDLASTAKLYKSWAFGDVYGYVVGRPELDEDGDEVSFDELDSCWGFYGAEFDESGLEEAAIEAALAHVKEDA